MSAIVNAPASGPAAVGVNTTLIVQFVFGWRATVQLFVCEKAPLARMLEIVIGVVPTFVATIGIEGLATPTA